ncbi:MAG: hypothetical protein K9M08_00355 [Pirellula sp.]|nr:hypothetical protein [Pirellula sp.]
MHRSNGFHSNHDFSHILPANANVELELELEPGIWTLRRIATIANDD